MHRPSFADFPLTKKWARVSTLCAATIIRRFTAHGAEWSRVRITRVSAIAAGLAFSFPANTFPCPYCLESEVSSAGILPAGVAARNNRQLKSGGRSFSSDMLPMPRLWASAPEASGLKSLLRGQLLLSDLKVRPPILATRGYPHPFLQVFIPGGFKSNEFVRALSKALTGAFFVRAHSKGVTSFREHQSIAPPESREALTAAALSLVCPFQVARSSHFWTPPGLNQEIPRFFGPRLGGASCPVGVHRRPCRS